MFSGKTEELIKRLNRAVYAKQRVLVVKPSVDVRYAESEVVSHSEQRIPCVPVSRAIDIPDVVGDAQVIGIDESQFFDDSLIQVCNALADDGRRVIVAGLDQDYLGRPFGPMSGLMAVAEYVTKNHAVCMVCGAPANRSQRLTSRDGQVLLGSTEHYEARCRRHWQPDLHDSQQEFLPLEST